MVSDFKEHPTLSANNKRLLIFVFGLIFSCSYLLSSDAQAFGPVDEKCALSAEKAVQPAPGSDLGPIIKTMKAGSTLLLEAGNYTLNSNTSIPAGTSSSPTTITAVRAANGQCAPVVIKMNGTLNTNNYVTIAGLTLERSANCANGSNDCFRYKSINVAASKNVVIRNNNFVSGGDLIYVTTNAANIQIMGNIFSGSKKWCIGVRGGVTDRVSITSNRFDYCFDDYIQAEDHKNLVISHNKFIGKSKNEILDIKVDKGGVTISHNWLDCNQNLGACVLFHADDYPPAAGLKRTFAHNTIMGCGGSSPRFLIMGGAKTYDYRDLAVEYNDFVDTKGLGCRIDILQCKNCTFRHNTVYNGRVRKLREASGTKIFDNIFHKTGLSTESPQGTCSHNVLYQVKGSFGNCTATRTENPSFTNPPMEMELAGPNSSAWKNASEGSHRGSWQGEASKTPSSPTSPTNLTVTIAP